MAIAIQLNKYDTVNHLNSTRRMTGYPLANCYVQERKLKEAGRLTDMGKYQFDIACIALRKAGGVSRFQAARNNPKAFNTLAMAIDTIDLPVYPAYIYAIYKEYQNFLTYLRVS